MRPKIWLIVVAAIVLFVIWTALLVASGYGHRDRLIIYSKEGVYNAPVWGLKQIVAYLWAVGSTVLAALVVGLWTTRRK